MREAAERLRIVGPIEGRPPAAFRRRLDVLAAADRVHHLGYVAPDRLTALYRHASALVLPSVYEGFGLPVLEAMKAATPVVASDIAPLREVAGDAALYVSRPFDSALAGGAPPRLRGCDLAGRASFGGVTTPRSRSRGPRSDVDSRISCTE